MAHIVAWNSHSPGGLEPTAKHSWSRCGESCLWWLGSHIIHDSHGCLFFLLVFLHTCRIVHCGVYLIGLIWASCDLLKTIFVNQKTEVYYVSNFNKHIRCLSFSFKPCNNVSRPLHFLLWVQAVLKFCWSRSRHRILSKAVNTHPHLCCASSKRPRANILISYSQKWFLILWWC